MKVLFVCPSFESIGIESLSAYLKKHGHETDLVLDPMLFDNTFLRSPVLSKIFNYREQVLDRIKASQPDLIAFSVTGFDLPWAYRTAAAAKELTGARVVFGGPHAWIRPEDLVDNEAVDFVVQGEGEAPLLEIARCVEAGDLSKPIACTWHRKDGEIIQGEVRPPPYELDELPFPDKDLFYNRLKHLNGYTVTTSRICHRGCSYCFYNVVKRLYYSKWFVRRRSVENVLAELEYAFPRYRDESVRFYDNDFTESPDWLSRFADGYAEKIGVPYHIQANPDSLTPAVIEDLRRSGCFEAQVGVQTVNPQTRKELGRTETPDEVRDVVNRMHKAGIRCCVDIIMGLPGEDETDALEAGIFFNQNRPTKINIFWLDYFPHSDISRQAYKKGILSSEDLKAIDEGSWIAGLFTGGKVLTKNRPLIRMQMLLTLLPVVSRGTFDWICRKRLYRFFPTRLGPPVFWIFVSLLVRHPKDMHRIRYTGLHREFLPKILLARLSEIRNRLFP